MKILKLTLLIAGCAGTFALGGSRLMAQEILFRDAPPPPQPRAHGRRASTMDELRFELEIKNNAQWAAVSGKIQAVLDARQALMLELGGHPRGGPGATARAEAVTFGPKARAELALFNAILNNEASDNVAAATRAVRLASLSEERQNETAYAKAQEDLRATLNARQQAQLTLFGILK